MKNVLYWFIIIIAAFAINGTFGLVMNEWEIGNICPKIIGIPACYIVLVCFIVALISHIIRNSKATWVYFFFVGIVTLIALTGTIGELAGMTKCPRTAGGIPMCFISLAICLSLLFSKIALLKYNKRQ
jgi:hypothetical protein